MTINPNEGYYKGCGSNFTIYNGELQWLLTITDNKGCYDNLGFQSSEAVAAAVNEKS